MPARETEAAERMLRRAAARSAQLERQHVAIRFVTQRARAGQMAPERAIALIAALLEGHAIAQLTPTLDPGKSRVSIVASDTASPDVRALLEQAQCPELEPAERDMIKTMRTEVGRPRPVLLEPGAGGGRGTLEPFPSATGRGGSGGSGSGTDGAR